MALSFHSPIGREDEGVVTMSDEKREELELKDNIELSDADKEADIADELSDEELNDVSGGHSVKGEHIKEGIIIAR